SISTVPRATIGKETRTPFAV
ncbi:hypothetical protein D046_1292B, partial [Vibrio parahaemolyticus V-223/04]